MVAISGAELFTRVHKLLKKKYDGKQVPEDDRTVLEHVVLGICLENSRLKAAQSALNRLKREFFDWNEVRVSSAQELEKVLDDLDQKAEKALRLKQMLYSLFESNYSFDLDYLQRKPLGQATKVLEKLEGVGPFVVAFTVQMALGGHAIPIDTRTVKALRRARLVEEGTEPEELSSRLERWIPKSRGREFSFLLHRLAADLDGAKEPAVLRSLREMAPAPTKRKRAATAKAPSSARPRTARKKTARKKLKK